MRAAAGEQGHQLVLARAQVAHVQALHAAPVQGLYLPRGVQVRGDDLVVQLDLHRFQLEQLAHVHGHEDRHLRVGGEEQFLLEHQQVAVQADDLGLQVLDACVQRRGGCRCRCCCCC